jgi:uncharacterized membrane protein YcjF (UPF0283 family)
MAAGAIAVLLHVTFHGYLFRCDFANCTTKATPWIIGFALGFVLQPATAHAVRHSYKRRDWIAWLTLAVALFALAFVTGKALHKYYYLFGREWILG